ncbi:MAG TPA: beta-propeller fold lactonase family protein [Gemmatimonadales bacterium]|nr:beta-propeller fold lactonase family protein [Gemmatimonadales bacterium]
MSKHLAFIALAAAALAACEQNRGITSPSAAVATPLEAQRGDDAPLAGPRAVYTLTNQVAGNAVAVFTRAADGTLSPAGTVATGGTGTGAGLGSQGAVALSSDGRWLFAVNAGSNDVSVLRMGAHGLSLASRTASGGTLPISLTVHGNVLYVLNAGGDGNISGFSVGPSGALSAIPGSTQALSGTNVGPADVAFSPDGRSLVVTEKTTGLLDVYDVNDNGVAGGLRSVTSAGGTPFGFAFGIRNLLFVSEAAAPGSASSYILGREGDPQVVSGVVLTHQGAPCWAVVTNDGRFGFTGNGSGSVSAFTIAPNGSISLLDANGATAVIAGGVNDIALSGDSRYLYALGTGAVPGIHTFRIEPDGHLVALGAVAGIPTGTRGLTAF